jgi:hypothetical protein
MLVGNGLDDSLRVGTRCFGALAASGDQYGNDDNGYEAMRH